MPLQRIALARGLGNLNTMRRGFVRNLGAAPLDYRKSFRSAYAYGANSKAKSHASKETGVSMLPRRGAKEPLGRSATSAISGTSPKFRQTSRE